ncbi:MAG: DsbA family protein, partial [Alphaproteobacteria bacterium]
TPIETRFVATDVGGFAIGADDAPVKIIEYGSYTCPHCTHFHEDVLPKLKEKYIDRGLVHFEFRSFVANGPDLLASMLVACEGAARFEPLSDLFFARLGGEVEWRQGSDPNAYVAELAKRAGVPATRFQQCQADSAMRDKLMAMRQGAIDDYNLRGTPTIVVNGKVRQNVNEWDALDRLVGSLLAQ